MRGVMGVVGWAALLAAVLVPGRGFAASTRTYPGSGACSTTLQACIDGAASGDTIEINTGDDTRIDEDIVISKSLTLTRATGAEPTIGGADDLRAISVSDPDLEANPEAGPVNVTISHLTLDNAVLSISLSAIGGHHVVVENCVISHGQTVDSSRGLDISLNTAATVIVRHNTIATTGVPLSVAADLLSGVTASITALGNTLTASVEEFSASGVTVDLHGSGTVDVDLHSNLIYGVGMCSCCGCASAAGIALGVFGRAIANVDIINNTLDDLQGASNGIQVRSPDLLTHLDLNLFNNVVSRAQGSAVQMPEQSEQLELANGYNAFHENGEDADWGGYSAGEHTIKVDPLYVNPLNYDYHLQSSSPLVGAGRNDPPGGLPTQDADGNARVAQGTVDIGALESNYVTVTTTTVVTSTTTSSSTTSITVVTTTTVAPTTTIAPTTTVVTTTVPTTTSTSVVTTTVSTVPGASTTTSVTSPTSTTAPVTTTTTTAPVVTTSTTPPLVTTTTTPSVVTTTTMPRPNCGEEASYASIVCRMDALDSQVRGAQAGQLTSKLLGALERAKAKTQEAQRLTTGGQAAKAKMSVRAAMRALSKMQVRLRSRAGKKIPDPLRSSMLDAAGRIGRDLRSLL